MEDRRKHRKKRQEEKEKVGDGMSETKMRKVIKQGMEGNTKKYK